MVDHLMPGIHVFADQGKSGVNVSQAKDIVDDDLHE